MPDEISKVIEIAKTNKLFDGNGKLNFQKSEIKERDWRSDPKDGLRPLIKIRKNIKFS